MKEQLARFYLDTAATAMSSTLMPALEMTGGEASISYMEVTVGCLAAMREH
jgi:hypothetical protein